MPFTVISRGPLPKSSPEHSIPSSAKPAPVRPQFNSHITSERLREGSHLQPLVSKMSGKITKDRQSIFTEVGLDVAAPNTARALASTFPKTPISARPHPSSTQEQDERSFGDITPLRPRSNSERSIPDRSSQTDRAPRGGQLRKRQNSEPPTPWYMRLAGSKGRPRIKSASGAPPRAVAGMQRVALIAVLIAVVLPAFTYSRGSPFEVGVAQAGPIRTRENSPTQVCKRWAHQAAEVNGTLYIYGGEAAQENGQTQNTWNNNFLALDLSEDWSIKSPNLKGLEVPDGPPAVANGYLWKDYNNLYLYGGQFSDSPYVDPAPESLWKYSIKDKTWTEFTNPQTSKGNYSTEAGQPVHRAAEGAGVSVPELGLSWYFGGHLDWATVPGWSRDIDRVYLKSLLEFTHPGYTNTAVDDIASSSAAADGGVYRNVTTGGVQKDDFPERADGVLVFVPGWGDSGVLIGMAGGTNDTFTDNLKTLTVYDIANSKWFHQETKGDPPSVRVNPCAVIASAPDASSFQIYMFGGQNLQPFEEQIQYDDLYILTIPSFTWIKADPNGDGPSARAGHTCTMRDGQMIVIGGVTPKDVGCDDPGIYVFNASSLTWQDKFKAGDHDADFHPDNGVLANSHGYSVPKAVQKVIGGDEEGGATASTPAAGPATGGPFATGKPPVFTITQSGATTTITPTSHPEQSDNDDQDEDSSSGDINPGLIAAGVIAGIAGAMAFYLGFCAWVYRRQVSAYKQHLAVANRYSGASTDVFRPPGAGILSGGRGRRATGHIRAPSHDSSDETFGWVGPGSHDAPGLTESKGSITTPDEPTPSGSGIGPGGVAISKKSEDTSGPHGSSSGDGGSTENLLDGQEPSFFNVVLGPRRALRVVNGMD